MDLNVPLGISFRGCGTVTVPGFRRVDELVVTTDYPIKHPSIFLQATNHLSGAEHKLFYILYVVRQDIRVAPTPAIPRPATSCTPAT